MTVSITIDMIKEYASSLNFLFLNRPTITSQAPA